jgi:beta-N-acetylhexosaminidase
MLDVRQAGAHDIVGDRAFSDEPEQVAKLGLAMANGLMDADVQPIIKHIPGHGRAMCDSHLDLPRVYASREELEVDFLPFKQLAHLPFAMTAHIIYEAIDAENCATQSKAVIDVIRNEIGFKGMIMTDDLSMKALTGTFAERTKRSLDAGCDLILHCNGDMAEMQEIAFQLSQNR